MAKFVKAVLEDLPTNMATASKPDASELAVVGPKFIGGVFGPGEGMGIRKSDADLTAKFDTGAGGGGSPMGRSRSSPGSGLRPT